MADKKISQLTAAAALTGTEVVPIVQSGATVKATTQDIADLAGGGGLPYKVYSARVRYSAGSGIIVNTLYQNTLEANITWSLGLSSNAVATADSSVFDVSKTVVITTPYVSGSNFYNSIGFAYSSAEVYLNSYKTSDGTNSVTTGVSFFIEIRVYP